MNSMLKRGLIAGVVNLIVGLLFQQFFGTIFPSVGAEYQNTALFRPWNDPLMTLFFAYPFILGIVLAYFWDMVYSSLKGNAQQKIFNFAKIYFLIATIPGMFISYTSFQVSALLVLSWTLSGFIEAYVAGWVFTRMK